MESANVKNRKIAKNTIYLYLRTFIIMLISLYTSRVILQALGEVNFGVYNVVGGVIVLFTFINNSMTTATQRYLISSLEGENGRSVTEVFSQAMIAHTIIAIIIIVAGETAGLWIVENKLNIPEGRENAAFWVYQLSILTAVLGILRCPYNAAVIAHENMSFYALASIAETLMKLAVSFLILLDAFDKLILYAVLLTVSSVIIFFVYYIYCLKKFPTIRFIFRKNIELLKEMTFFSIWSLLGNASVVGINQGASIILNIFYGVVVNAALGIANQMNAVIGSFVSNFQTAFMPQITKSYVSRDFSYLESLILRTSRYSFLLLFVVSFPVFFNCEYLLKLWLGDVPDYTAGLVKVIITCSVFDGLSGPLWMLALAMGNIRRYQITVSLVSIFNLVLLYCAAKVGIGAVSAFSTKVIILLALYIYRRIYIDSVVSISTAQWMKSVYGKIILLIAFAGISAWFTSMIYVPVLRLIVDGLIGIMIVYSIGLAGNERKKVLTAIKVKVTNLSINQKN